MVFGFTEASLVVGLTALAIFALPAFPSSANKQVFKTFSKHGMITFNFVFGGWVAVAVLFGLSGFYFIQNAPTDSWQLIAGIVLFLTNLVLVHFYHRYMWHHEAHDSRHLSLKGRYLLYLHGMITATAIAATVMFGCIGLVNDSLLYLIPTIAWALYSLGLIGGTILHNRLSDKLSAMYSRELYEKSGKKGADEEL